MVIPGLVIPGILESRDYKINPGLTSLAGTQSLNHKPTWQAWPPAPELSARLLDISVIKSALLAKLPGYPAVKGQVSACSSVRSARGVEISARAATGSQVGVGARAGAPVTSFISMQNDRGLAEGFYPSLGKKPACGFDAGLGKNDIGMTPPQADCEFCK